MALSSRSVASEPEEALFCPDWLTGIGKDDSSMSFSPWESNRKEDDSRMSVSPFESNRKEEREGRIVGVDASVSFRGCE